MSITILIGAPIDDGQRRQGCVMGPAAYRVAGIHAAIADLGHTVTDWGDLTLPALSDATCPNPVVHHLPKILGWTQTLADRVDDALSQGGLPIILGGDHSLALGTVTGAATYANRHDRPLFLLWLELQGPGANSCNGFRLSDKLGLGSRLPGKLICHLVHLLAGHLDRGLCRHRRHCHHH